MKKKRIARLLLIGGLAIIGLIALLTLPSPYAHASPRCAQDIWIASLDDSGDDVISKHATSDTTVWRKEWRHYWYVSSDVPLITQTGYRKISREFNTVLQEHGPDTPVPVFAMTALPVTAACYQLIC